MVHYFCEVKNNLPVVQTWDDGPSGAVFLLARHDGGQVSCDWWTAGQCSPVIGCQVPRVLHLLQHQRDADRGSRAAQLLRGGGDDGAVGAARRQVPGRL